MCNFCEFEYGVAVNSINKKELNYNVIHEIRPTIHGKYLYLVRVLNLDKSEIITKSSVFIEYCPMCGRKLGSIKFPVLESNEEIEIKLNNLGTTMYKEDGTFKSLTELLDDIGGML